LNGETKTASAQVIDAVSCYGRGLESPAAMKRGGKNKLCADRAYEQGIGFGVKHRIQPERYVQLVGKILLK
jgi:hypothetical protein